VEQALFSCTTEPEQEFDPLEYFSERFRMPPEAIDGWQIAQRLTRPGCEISAPGMRERAERLAVRSVLERAARLVGPLRGATHVIVEPLREPYQGELELEGTFENLLGKQFPGREDWLVERRQERRTQIALMMDTSLSMSGANMALAAVAAAVLALKMKPADLSVVVFENDARAISHLEEDDAPASWHAAATRASTACSSPTGCTRVAATRRRWRRPSRGCSCCSPRTTR